MRRAREATIVPLPADEALELWTDLQRWPSFVEGFARVVEADSTWPAPGARIVWESAPGGRGRVTERVTAYEPGRSFSTQVFEEQLTGTQSFSAGEAPPGGGAPADEAQALVELKLEYQLSRSGPLAPVTDFLFIRRALSDSLRRTLRRYAVEAREKSAL